MKHSPQALIWTAAILVAVLAIAEWYFYAKTGGM